MTVRLPRTLPVAEAGMLARWSLERAAEVVCLTRDSGADAIGEFLDRLDRQALYGLVVTLAAMVPDDVPAAELLGWIDELAKGAAA